MVKPGYKQTEIGVIPENWIVRRLSECTKRVGVGLATSVTQYYREDGVPIFRNLNIKPGYLDDSDILYLDPDFANRQESKKIRTGDVLTVHTGYVGISCVVPAKYNNALTFTTLITTTDDNLLLPEFLSIYLNSSFGALEIESLQAGGGRNNLNVNDFVNFRIPLPLISEQRKIIEYLKEIDRYLEFIDRQLSKKKAIKQGAMQELLTGKKRLPGFSGEWENIALGKVSSFYNGGTPSKKREDWWTGNIPWISSSDLSESTITSVKISRFISQAAVEHSATRICPKNAVLIVSRVGVGKVAVSPCELCTSQDFTTVVSSRHNPYFLAYILIPIMKDLAIQAQGTSIKGVTTEDIQRIAIPTPSVDEQNAIVNILANMDSEIETLERKLEKYRQVKQGMMQQLLTGKIRLV